jgi:hypothetical protein
VKRTGSLLHVDIVTYLGRDLSCPFGNRGKLDLWPASLDERFQIFNEHVREKVLPPSSVGRKRRRGSQGDIAAKSDKLALDNSFERHYQRNISLSEIIKRGL